MMSKKKDMQLIRKYTCETCPLRKASDQEKSDGVSVVLTAATQQPIPEQLRSIAGNAEGESFPLNPADPKTAVGHCAAKILVGNCGTYMVHGREYAVYGDLDNEAEFPPYEDAPFVYQTGDERPSYREEREIENELKARGYPVRSHFMRGIIDE